MIEHRHNWKENVSKQARERAQARHVLLVKLDETRREIQGCGTNYQRYDKLKLSQREIVARLAAL